MQKLEFLEAKAYRLSNGEGGSICLRQMEIILNEIDQVRAKLLRVPLVNVHKDYERMNNPLSKLSMVHIAMINEVAKKRRTSVIRLFEELVEAEYKRLRL